MCDDVHETADELKARGLEFTKEITDERRGLTDGAQASGRRPADVI